ncbi:MAG: PAS domain S-box protein [Vicinamibacterales bacterium]
MTVATTAATGAAQDLGAPTPESPPDTPELPGRLWGLALLVGFSLATAVASHIYYREFSERLRTETARELSAETDLKSAAIWQWRRERLGDARRLAGDTMVAAMTRDLLARPDGPAEVAAFERLFSTFAYYRQYDALLVFDAQGTLRLSLPAREPPVDQVLVDGAVRALDDYQVALLDLYRVGETDAPRLASVVPILDEHTRPLGVVVLRIDPALSLYPLTTAWPTDSETTETLLVRRDGDGVLFLNDLRFSPDAALRLRMPMTHRSLLAVQAVLGGRGVREGTDYRDAQVLGAVARVPDSPWYVVTRIDKAELAARLASRLSLILIIGTLAILSTGAGIGLLLWRQRVAAYRRYAGATQALQASGLKMRTLLGNSPTVIYTLQSVDGRLEPADVSENVERLFGYTPAEALQRNWWIDHVHPEDREDTARRMASLDDRDSLSHEYRFIRKDGGTVWIHDDLRVTRREGGRPADAFGAWNDVTARRIEQQRAVRLTRLYAALSQTNEAIVRSTTERELFDRVCTAAVDHGGMALAWVGMVDPTGDVRVVASYGAGVAYLDDIRISARADDPHGRGPVGTAIRESRAYWLNDFPHAEATAPWRDRGQPFGWQAAAALPLTREGVPVGALTLYAYSPEAFDEDGQRLLGEMASDISFALGSFSREASRLATEHALRESEQRYRTMFAEGGLPMLLINPDDGRIVDANTAAQSFYGWDRSTLLGMSIGDITLLPPDELRAALVQAASGAARFAFRHRIATGAVREVDVFASTIVVQGQRRLLSTVVDVTSRRNAENALRCSLSEKDSLLHEVHHRVKNNLQVVSSLLRLEGRRSHDADVQAVLRDMRSRILTMALLHETLYRSENLAGADLGAYFEQLARAIFPSMGASPAVVLQRDLARVLVPLKQAVPCGLIVNELLSNALKHAFPGGQPGTVRLSLVPPGADGQVRIVVADTGVGLPPDFEARAKASLGVQLVHDLARQLGGTLHVDRDGGTTVTLSFTPAPPALPQPSGATT